MAECKRAFGGNRDKASSNTWGCAHPRPLQGFANPDPNLRASIGLAPAKALVLLVVSWWRDGRLASGDKDGRCSYPLISDRCHTGMGFRTWILLAVTLLAFFAKMIFKSLPAIGVRAQHACRATIASQSPDRSAQETPLHRRHLIHAPSGTYDFWLASERLAWHFLCALIGRDKPSPPDAVFLMVSPHKVFHLANCFPPSDDPSRCNAGSGF
jgi:hypothetical protein